MSVALRLGALAALALIAGCEAGPDYVRRVGAGPCGLQGNRSRLKVNGRKDAIDRGIWWSIYRDPALDGLERQIAISNQTLKADEAAFRQSEALAAAARAGLFPTLHRQRLGPSVRAVGAAAA